MRRNLGSLLILWLLALTLHAHDLCDVKVWVSKHDPYAGEEIRLKVEAIQKRTKNAMFFDFHAPKSPSYTLKLLSKDEKRGTQNKEVIFHYLLKPLKEGNLTIPLSIVVKEASRESVKDFVTGSFDEMEMLQTRDTTLKIEPLHLQVKPLKEPVECIGAFQLNAQISAQDVAPFAPVYLTLTLQGKGSHNRLENLIPPIKGVDRFVNRSGEQKLEYVFSSDHNFTIPSAKLRCYDPKQDRYYSLQTPAYPITVHRLDPATIVDKEDSFEADRFHLADLLNYLYALLIFVAGYLSAKFKLFERRSRTIAPDDPVDEKIKRCHTPKALLHLLLSQPDQHRYQKEIEVLEGMVYRNEKGNLNNIKEQLFNRSRAS